MLISHFLSVLLTSNTQCDIILSSYLTHYSYYYDCILKSRPPPAPKATHYEWISFVDKMVKSKLVNLLEGALASNFVLKDIDCAADVKIETQEVEIIDEAHQVNDLLSLEEYDIDGRGETLVVKPHSITPGPPSVRRIDDDFLVSTNHKIQD